jgi:hypothetical protein
MHTCKFNEEVTQNISHNQKNVFLNASSQLLHCMSQVRGTLMLSFWSWAKKLRRKAIGNWDLKVECFNYMMQKFRIEARPDTNLEFKKGSQFFSEIKLLYLKKFGNIFFLAHLFITFILLITHYQSFTYYHSYLY